MQCWTAPFPGSDASVVCVGARACRACSCMYVRVFVCLWLCVCVCARRKGGACVCVCVVCVYACWGVHACACLPAHMGVPIKLCLWAVGVHMGSACYTCERARIGSHFAPLVPLQVRRTQRRLHLDFHEHPVQYGAYVAMQQWRTGIKGSILAFVFAFLAHRAWGRSLLLNVWLLVFASGWDGIAHRERAPANAHTRAVRTHTHTRKQR